MLFAAVSVLWSIQVVATYGLAFGALIEFALAVLCARDLKRSRSGRPWMISGLFVLAFVAVVVVLSWMVTDAIRR